MKNISIKKDGLKPLIYFSDYFGIDEEVVSRYGALNISLVNDLPLFIDPFLLFESKKNEYKRLHDQIISYVKFLKTIATTKSLTDVEIEYWFYFPEVKQNWLGFSRDGNGGSGLGREFAGVLTRNLKSVFSNFGEEVLTKSSHLEKLCLMSDHVGRDHLSDFTTNLIKKYLLEYTQEFAIKNLSKERISTFAIDKVEFDFETKKWTRALYQLPNNNGDYVLLTPKDILTKDDAWINRGDLVNKFQDIYNAIPDALLRGRINEYFLNRLAENPTKNEVKEVASKAIEEYPQILDFYIKDKEDKGREAVDLSRSKVSGTERRFVKNVQNFVACYLSGTDFYESDDSYEESMRRLLYLKHVIENNDGYKFFYVNGLPVQRELDLQIMFRLTWAVSSFEVDGEVNNGRGPVDFKISKGRENKALVEFKLAANTKLKQNLKNQIQVYQKANNTKKSIKAILYFDENQEIRVKAILKELKLSSDPSVVLIDARRDNKPSGSNAKS